MDSSLCGSRSSEPASGRRSAAVVYPASQVEPVLRATMDSRTGSHSLQRTSWGQPRYRAVLRLWIGQLKLSRSDMA